MNSRINISSICHSKYLVNFVSFFVLGGVGLLITHMKLLFKALHVLSKFI